MSPELSVGQCKKVSELNDTIRHDTIDDLHWKTDGQAASLI